MAKEGDDEIRKALARALGEGCPVSDVVAFPDFWNRIAGGGVEASGLMVDLFIDYLGVAVKIALFRGADISLENFGVFSMERTDARMGSGALAEWELDGRWRACFRRSEIGWDGLGPLAGDESEGAAGAE